MLNSTKHGEWIPQYEGLYSVTRDGKVYSHQSSRVSRIGSAPDLNGNILLLLRNGKEQLIVYAHVVVAMTYMNHDAFNSDLKVVRTHEESDGIFKKCHFKSNRVEDLKLVPRDEGELECILMQY